VDHLGHFPVREHILGSADPEIFRIQNSPTIAAFYLHIKYSICKQSLMFSIFKSTDSNLCEHKIHTMATLN